MDEFAAILSILKKINQSKKSPTLPSRAETAIETTSWQLLLLKDAIFLKKNDCYHKVNYKDIIFVKMESNYCEFYTQSKKYLYKITLSRLLEQLPQYFIRIHRSHLINLYHLEKFCLNKNQLTIDGFTLVFARKYKKHFANLVLSS